jgi:MSHA biogenesis protein MshI
MNLNGFKLSRIKSGKPGLCGLQITHSGIAISYVLWKNGAPTLVFCDFLPSTDAPELFLPMLTYYVKKNNLEGVRCSWILQSENYTLLPAGNLPVAKNEILPALRFYVKDRIDYPVSEASIEYFSVPAPKQSQVVKEDFIYAIVAKKEYLDKTANLINESGLNLNIIDIPELALRNIAALSPQEKNQKNMGIIDVGKSRTTLFLLQDSQIHFIRQIEWEEKQGIEKLSSEIHRSLDYYENELGHSSIQQFYLSPAYQIFSPALKENLSLDMYELDWDKLKDKRCLVAVGGALRQEEFI